MSTAPRLIINLDALVRNWRCLAKQSGAAEASAVIKADAYGLGIEEVAKALLQAGCKTFFTAMVEEGIKVRELSDDARIFILNGVFAETISTAIDKRLTPVLSSSGQIDLWGETGNEHPCAIHVDTGMNRLGLGLKEAESLARDKDRLAAINPCLLMSHLACGDDPEHPMNREQLDRFRAVAQHFPHLKKCFANSAGITHGPDFHFDLTRPGISIYGGEAVNDVPNPMEPVVTAEARILQIRTTQEGETVGYGAAHKVKEPQKIAICSAGYADGFHRSGSGTGVALRRDSSAGTQGAIGGYRVPVVGRVSMDLTAFDVSEVPDQVLETHEWVELFGKTIAVDDAARSCGTIGYELLTSLGQRYHRTYQKQVEG